MSVRLFRSGLVAIVMATSMIVSIAVSAGASATPPSPLAFTPTAARSFAGGGPASLVVVNARTATTMSDGSVVYYDSDANQLRRVDSATRLVSPVAGNGQSTTADAPDTVAAPLDAALPPIDGLWTDSADDIFARFCAGPNCENGHDLYRLGTADDHWQLVLDAGGYAGIAVLSTGAVIAVDTTHFVLRRIDEGADPASAGSVIAGTVNVPGSAGDGGPATSATINPGGPVAVSDAGDVYFADGGWQRNIRHISATGTISSLTDDGFDSTPASNIPSVTGLAVSKDGATLYAVRTDLVNESEIRAVPVGGGPARTVAGPLPACASDSTDCIATSITEAPVSGTTSVIAAGQGALLSWPADASAPLAYNRYAGVLDDANGVRSPDGVDLNEAFLSPIYDLAAAPDGTIAIATADGIRTVSGLSADSVLGTAVPKVSAQALQYSTDGTLYAMVPDPTPHVIALAPRTGPATVLGGGAQPVADGADGTAVQLGYDPRMAVDPSNGDVFFDDGDATIWRLDASTDVIHRVGDVSAYTNEAGALGVTTHHDVVVDTGAGAVQVAADGTTSLEDCTSDCPVENLHTLSDGSLIGDDADGSLVIQAVDGTVERLAGNVSSMSTLTSDQRIVVPGTDGWAGGLLSVSNPITAATSADAPTVNVNPTAGGVNVAVSPHATNQHIQIYAGAQDSDGEWINQPTLEDDTDTGTGDAAYSRELDHLFTTWPNAASNASSQSTYRIEVVASETDSAGDTVFDAPQVFHIQPAADTTAPQPPTVTLTNGGTSANVDVTRPNDPDLDRVVVCKTTDEPVPVSPWGCDDVGEIRYFDAAQQTFNESIDPMSDTTFTAFSIDASGNTSSGVSRTRSAAHLVAGPAESQLAYDAQPGLEEVMWDGGWALHVRYAPGSSAPATMSDGTEAPKQYDGSWGYGAQVPVEDGSQVAVSLFAYADDALTTYRRTSFVLTAGSNSEIVSLDATPTVDSGTQPAISASVVRNVPTGGHAPVSAAVLHLYHRLSGSRVWSEMNDATTTSTGTATFTVKAPTQTTDYQVRFNARSIDGKVASSAVATTSVRQMLTMQLPAHVKRGHTLTVTGTLGPHHTATVSLQRLVGKRWITLASHKSTSTGAYTITYRPPSLGKWSLRTTVAATPALLSGATTTRSLTVD